MSVNGVGIDVVEVSRFHSFERDVAHPFLLNNFSEEERSYCFSYQNSAVHLAGTFAAKEAVVKAFRGEGVHVSQIEIRRTQTGAPVVYRDGQEIKTIFISISHTQDIATAIAIHTS